MSLFIMSNNIYALSSHANLMPWKHKLWINVSLSMCVTWIHK